MFGIADNHEFLSKIGVENAPNRDEIVAQLETLAQQKFIIKLSEKLTNEQLEELDSIEDEEQVARWIQTNVPDFDKLAEAALAEIKYDILINEAAVLG